MIINQLKLAEDQREIMQRIAPRFPVSIYQTDFSVKPYKSVIWHWHEDFQFCWVYRGSVRFQVVDQSYILNADSGIFINCRLAHTAEPLSPEAAYYCVDTHPDLICPDPDSSVYKQMVEPFVQSTRSPVFVFSGDTPDGFDVLRSLKKIFNLFHREELLGRELLIQSEILRLWPSILKRAQRVSTPVNAVGNDRIKKIVTYIEEHYAEKITLRSISEQIFLSPEECSRYFKKMIGTSLFQFIIQYRIKKSLDLLLNTELTIAEVAQHCGFSTQSYYTACFKKIKGCTPNQYRNSPAQYLNSI